MAITKQDVFKYMKTKRYYLVFCVAFFCFPVVKCIAKGLDSLKRYYTEVNQAELAICDSNYIDAKAYYKKAFIYRKPFSRDLNNAFVISYTLKDSFLARDYAKLLAERGIPINKLWIKSDSIANPSLFQFVTKDVDSIFNNSKFVNGTYKLFNKLYKQDQAVREYGVPIDSMSTIDSIHLAAIENYMKKYGYPKPGESNQNNGDIISETVKYFCHLLLWHQRFFYKPEKLDSLLLIALNNGRLSSDEWEVFTMYRKGHQEKYASRFWLVSLDSLNKEEIEKINKNRASRYLESLEDYKKKYDYEKKIEQLYGCSVYGSISLLPGELVPSDNAINAGLK